MGNGDCPVLERYEHRRNQLNSTKLLQNGLLRDADSPFLWTPCFLCRLRKSCQGSRIETAKNVYRIVTS